MKVGRATRPAPFGSLMPSHSKDAFVPQAPPVSPAPVAHEGAARAFWRVLTPFASSNPTPYHGLGNPIGVLPPVSARFALNMPRAGVAGAIGGAVGGAAL